MGIWDKLRGELIDIIEWLDESNNTLVYRFERYGNEIKYGAKLVVRQAQSAVFVNQGQIADVFGPGMYELKTDNLPILSTLMGWKYGFESPFKAEVYFVNTRQFTDQKWGTRNPIMLRDAEFGPVRLRAFGNYAFRVADSRKFMEQIVGTDGHFTLEEITNQLRNMVITRFTDLLGESKIPILDLASNYDELSEFIGNKLAPEYQDYGLEVTKFLVENISLPPAVEEALDKRSQMGIVGNLNAYTQFQAANAMENLSENPGTGGGMAGGGMGMGMGFAMANQMGQSLANPQGQPQQQPPQQPAAAPAGPPPIPGAVSYYLAVNGQQAGPFDMNALKQQAAGGHLTPDSLVWKQGMANWSPAKDTPELAGLFAGPTPPPIPGQ